MKQYDGKTFLFSSMALILLLVLVIMTACAPTAKKDNTINPIVDAKSIGKALGCMFAPDSCKNDRGKNEKEFIETFKKIDAENNQQSK